MALGEPHVSRQRLDSVARVCAWHGLDIHEPEGRNQVTTYPYKMKFAGPSAIAYQIGRDDQAFDDRVAAFGAIRRAATVARGLDNTAKEWMALDCVDLSVMASRGAGNLRGSIHFAIKETS